MYMNEEIEIHILGLKRLQSIGDVEIKDDETMRLSEEITRLCRESKLTYPEVQKAIVFADNSLYYRVRVNDNDAPKA